MFFNGEETDGKLKFFLGKCNLIKQKGSICMRELKDKRSLSDNFGDSIYICEGN